MNWKRLGLVFQPIPDHTFLVSHAQLPTPFHLKDSVYRVFFASRDKDPRSYICSFDIDLDSAPKIVSVNVNPILSPGKIGSFTEHGVYPSSVVKVGDEYYLYFIGWNRGSESPLFYASIGLAVSKSLDGPFEIWEDAPVLQRSRQDPLLVTAPNVIRLSQSFVMYYTSGIEWYRGKHGSLKSIYAIRKAVSSDGKNWTPTGEEVIPFLNDETNQARTTVYFDGNKYKMLFSVAKEDRPYRIAEAESLDGIHWTRQNEGIKMEGHGDGSDSNMQAYPAVIRQGSRFYMFYNGNEFGREGISLATFDFD